MNLKKRRRELLLHLLDLFREQKVSRTKSLTDAQRSVELFLDSLKASYAEEWSIDSMADCCGLGVTRFVHYCRQITNLSPMQYLNQVRLEVAVELLKTDRKIIDVAMDCGFSTSQYFATAFKKLYGCTPRQYRSKI